MRIKLVNNKKKATKVCKRCGVTDNNTGRDRCGCGIEYYVPLTTGNSTPGELILLICFSLVAMVFSSGLSFTYPVAGVIAVISALTLLGSVIYVTRKPYLNNWGDKIFNSK